MTQELTDDAFEDRFHPELDESGEGYHWRDWHDHVDSKVLLRAAEDARVWTLVDAEGELLLVSGMHLVNAVHWVVCAVPTPFGHDFIVPM